MIKEFQAFVTLFQQGKEIPNAAKVRNKAAFTHAVAAVLSAAVCAAGGFGYHVNLDANTTQDIAAGAFGLYTLVMGVLHAISDSKVGVSSDTGDSQ